MTNKSIESPESVEQITNIPEEPYFGSQYILPEQSGDVVAKAINFKISLGEVQQYPMQVIDFDSVIDQANERNHKTLSQECLEIVLSEVQDAPHTYFYTYNAYNAERIQKLRNVFISRTSIGETSAHKVFFALLTSDDDQLRVAVKPFVSGNIAEKTITDWSNTLLARKNGLDTFEPLGFMICNGVGYTLTERQDDIDSMDNVDWSRALLSSDNESLINDITKIGPALARLNHLGIFHGDPQMKNGVLTQRGSMHWIDWEASTVINRNQDQPSQKNELLIREKTVRDLLVLFNSLARSVGDNGVGLLDGKTPLAQYQSFDELVLSPYVNERLRLIDNSNPAKAEAILLELGEVEQDISDYIKTGALYNNLKRSRHN